MFYDFNLNHPVNIHFGKGALNYLADEIKVAGNKAMLVYGGGSIKKTGVYDKITGVLKEAGIEWVDFGGCVKPWYADILKAVDICKKEGVDCVIGIGGSTCMDMAKVIAAGAANDGDLWEYIKGAPRANKGLRIGAIPTYPSGGSETSRGAVVDDQETGGNGTMYGVIPDFSIINPEYAYTLDAKNTAYGAVIAFMQISLNYFTGDSPISERLIEGLLDTIRDSVKVSIEKPEDYQARANQALASIYGTNVMPSLGKSREWVYNVYDYIGIIRRQLGISYRETFSIIFPYWLKAEAKYHGDEIKNYMVKIWGVDANLSEEEAVDEGSKKIIDFYESIGLPMKYNLVAKTMPSKEQLIKATEAEYYDGMMPMNEIVQLFEACMEL